MHNVNETIFLPLPASPDAPAKYFSICIVKYRYSRGIYSHPSSARHPPPIRLRNLRRGSPYKTELRQFCSSLPFSLFPLADFEKVVRGRNFYVTSIQCPTPPPTSTAPSFAPVLFLLFVLSSLSHRVNKQKKKKRKKESKNSHDCRNTQI